MSLLKSDKVSWVPSANYRAIHLVVFNVNNMWWKSWGLFFIVSIHLVECFNLVKNSSHPVHCWQTRNCTGAILQSFEQLSSGCMYGCMSYIRSNKTDLEKILTSKKKLQLLIKTQNCVTCPTPSQKTNPPLLKCTSKSCPPKHKCISGRPGHIICLNCSKLRCKKSGILCGTDGKTYKNECDMMCLSKSGANATKEAYQGPCQANPTCKTIKCKIGWKCKSSTVQQNNGAVGPISSLGSIGSISSQGARCVSPGYVCGSDGHTYASMKDLFKAMVCSAPIKVSKKVSKRYDGPCNASDKPRKVTPCFLQILFKDVYPVLL